jgi:hypothetical protein
MDFFLRLTIVLGICSFSLKTGYAQTMYKYKIVFKEEVSMQSEEAKTFLQKYTSNSFSNSLNSNELIIISAKQINKDIFSGKLEKLKAPVKSIDFLDIVVNTPSTERNTTAPISEKEVLDKSTKSQQQQLEIKNKQVFAEPNRRY